MPEHGLPDGPDIRCESREHEGYVVLACSGSYVPGAQVRIAKQALEAAIRAGRDAVLIDIRGVTGRAPTMAERYEQATRVAELQLRTSPRIRMALLGHEPMVHPQRFGEVVATNRGGTIRVFTDERLALEWLNPAPGKT